MAKYKNELTADFTLWSTPENTTMKAGHPNPRLWYFQPRSGAKSWRNKNRFKKDSYTHLVPSEQARQFP